jgi:hypothetical protein
MGVDAHLRKAVGGEIVQTVGDPQSELGYLLRDPSLQATCCLKFIDPFGYTTFNRAQCKILEAELMELRARHHGSSVEQIDRLLRLVEVATRKAGYDIHFVGE